MVVGYELNGLKEVFIGLISIFVWVFGKLGVVFVLLEVIGDVDGYWFWELILVSELLKLVGEIFVDGFVVVGVFV